MSVERNLPLVRERKQAILKGDPDRAAEQKKLGKLTARERIGLLFDAASFVELDTLAGKNGESGVITGYGLIDGQPVYVYAQDYTVLGGAVGAEQARKIVKVQELAQKTGSPVIAMLDSRGARLLEGIEAVDAYARISAKTASLSGVVPQIALVMGQCAASGAMIAAMNDIVIVAESGRVFMNGPQVVSANTGDTVDAKALGGPEAAMESGLAALACAGDEEAIACARRIVAMLPGNNLEDAPVNFTQADDMNRALPAFNAIDTVTDIKEVISAVSDGCAPIELYANWAPEMVTCLAAIGGRTVGIVGTQPSVGGGELTSEGCRKAARFVRFCDCFSIPVVTFVDTLGIAVTGKDGQGELARACAQLNAAYADATTARLAVVTGNAIAVGYMALASRPVADMVYAWPGAVIAPLTTQAAVQVLSVGKLKGIKNPNEVRAELEKDYQDNIADGLNAAKLGLVDDVIEPAETRQMLAAALEMLAAKREVGPAKKHGNLPL
ncbi:MAG: methylmalonyl-CoA carboxyltransferase [Clostridia bacterium]|nr:methylmalonyl-CoA carboxyltransferase [Clostridia bacterium]